ncbi:hypothetical protein HYN43_024375 [Mucilaginibacter celer]|uniref:Uncharacterized protein n=1 Tax=Mucilaginibacter celer TaxID=2305508 RepID=A0A494W3Y6_9SPHI|nr:hypothetical protein HYN43_024375 [Mucilaginibacter celer]
MYGAKKTRILRGRAVDRARAGVCYTSDKHTQNNTPLYPSQEGNCTIPPLFVFLHEAHPPQIIHCNQAFTSFLTGVYLIFAIIVLALKKCQYI